MTDLANSFSRFFQWAALQAPGPRPVAPVVPPVPKTESPYVKSFRLLKENITPAQWQSYITHGYFDVIGGETGNAYRIMHGSMSNVWRRGNRNLKTMTYCLVTERKIPLGDILLMQKLTIELEESYFKRTSITSVETAYGFDNESSYAANCMRHLFNFMKVDPREI